MSQITENTLVIKNKYIKELKRTIKNDGYSSRLDFEEFIEVYKNDEISIFTFDCNGSPMCINEDVHYEILETNYLDDDSYWTQTKEGYSDKTAIELIKDLVASEDYELLSKQLLYSNQYPTNKMFEVAEILEVDNEFFSIKIPLYYSDVMKEEFHNPYSITSLGLLDDRGEVQNEMLIKLLLGTLEVDK